MKQPLLKKIFIAMVMLCVMIALVACGGSDTPSTDQNPSSGQTSADQLDGTPGGTADENQADNNLNPAGDGQSSEGDSSEDEDFAGETGKNQLPDPADNPPQNDSDYGVAVISTLTHDDGNLLVLVNKEYTVTRDYYPTDMVDIDGSLSTNQNLKVKREAYDAYKKMLADAQAEGLNFSICSAYRSYELQESLYYNSLSANGKEYTDKMFAYPGRSEHHTGYAIDVTSASMNWGLSQDYTNYPDGAWITEHCDEYGFIIRYPKGKEDITGYMYEPWHIRYVGVDIAKEITEKGITFEEYMGVA